MKKAIIALFSGLAVLSCFGKENRVLLSSQPVAFKKTYVASQSEKRNSVITYNEMKEDVDLLIYNIETAYAGYDVMLENGFHSQELKEYFEKLYEGKNEIDTYDFYKRLSDYLRPYPLDSHFSIIGTQGKEFDTLTPKAVVYYTDIFVERQNDRFTVSKSTVPGVKVGSEYTDSVDNLFYYPSKGADTFRIGKISAEKIESADFAFNEKIIRVPVASDRTLPASTLIKYHEIESASSSYVSLSSFLLPDSDSPYRKGAEIVFEKFINSGNKWRNKENIIIDLRSNLGGRIFVGTAFIYSFLQKKPYLDSKKMEKKIDRWKETALCGYEEIESPSVLQAHIMYYKNTGETDSYYYKKCVKKLNRQTDNPVQNLYKVESMVQTGLKSYFDGTIIFLIDRNSASASENLVFLAKKILGNEKVFVVGENSAGCFTYYDVLCYLLPNSRLSVQLGSKKETVLETFSQWHGEGRGIYPDYWAAGSDLNETIYLITGDDEMKEKLKDIEYRLM